MEEKFDVVIAGAGASGLMCAWQCGRQGKKVLVMEKTKLPARKYWLLVMADAISAISRCGLPVIMEKKRKLIKY